MDTQYATIVKLSPSQKQVEVVDFDTAFGAHSEFFGKKGRARRQKRKAARQQKRLTRIKMRGERKAARQAIRAQQQEARQLRKDKRKSRKVARKAMGEEESEAQEPEIEDQNYTPEAEYQEQEQESDYEDTPVEEMEEEDEYEEEESFDGESVSEARGRRFGGGLKRAIQNRKAAKAAKKQAKEEEPIEEGGECFDGESSDATGVPVKPTAIHPPIKDLTHRIVWNKEAMKRHKAHQAQLQAKYNQVGQNPYNRKQLGQYKNAIDALTMDIQKHDERITNLENQLKKFGDHPHIPHGYKLAQTALQKQIEGKANIKDKAIVKSTLAPTKGYTIISPGINAEISKNRIDIPADPTLKTVEIASNFGGDTIKGMSTGTKWLIGLAVVGVAVVLAKKYKVI